MAFQFHNLSLPDIPEDILADNPYYLLAEAKDAKGEIKILLFATPVPARYAPRDIFGIPTDAIADLDSVLQGAAPTGAARAWSEGDSKWGSALSFATYYFGTLAVPVGDVTEAGLEYTTMNVMCANYDIKKVIGADEATYSLIFDDTPYFKKNSDTVSIPERLSVAGSWITSIANQVRRLANTWAGQTTEGMLSALENAKVPGLTDWIEDSTFDYTTKAFSSDAEYVYAPPAFSLVSSGVVTIDLPNAVEIKGEKIDSDFDSGIWNDGALYRSPFTHCESLTSINAPKLKYMGYGAFQGCTGLKEITMPSLVRPRQWAFKGCTGLEKVDLSEDLSNIGEGTFVGCTSLVTVILRKNGLVGNPSSYAPFSNTPIANGTGYIYVPSAYVDKYKTDNITTYHWSTYANQIRAIEDYPDICGAT